MFGLFKKPSWNTFIFGKPGSGKSLEMAKIAEKIFKEYAQIDKKYPELPKRTLWSNMKFNSFVEKKFLDKKLFYWDSPFQLKDLRNVDILWDEIANHLPADSWADNPRWLRSLFAQHRKRGIRLFCNTQDYHGVDINYRRMVTRCWYVKKLIGSRDISATLPPVKTIWGFYIRFEIDPELLEQEKDKEKLIVLHELKPSLRFITKRVVGIFDTTQDIPAYSPDKLEHIEMICDKCKAEGKPEYKHKLIRHRAF